MKGDKTPSKIGQRLWSRDASLWTGEADEQAAIENRLGWLDAPVWFRSKINGLVSWADEIRTAGFDRAVVLGMGGSSLAAEVMARIFGQGPGGLALTVLDNTHPDAVRAVLESGHLESTLFLVASKSGTTLEANVFLATFLEALRQRVGGDAGNHFVVITDADTPLARRTAEEGFRHCFINPGDIGGRYSALTFFGMVPAALLGLDLSSLCDGAETALADARLFEAGEDNSALDLGLFLGHWAGRGRDKLCVLLSPALAPLSVWIEQLIAESTGKRGVGIVPVADARVSLDAYGADRIFVAVGLVSDVDLAQRCQAILRLTTRRSPFYDRRWDRRASCCSRCFSPRQRCSFGCVSAPSCCRPCRSALLLPAPRNIRLRLTGDRNLLSGLPWKRLISYGSASRQWNDG